ncbi:MAG: TetR/AcrR family transcriptional regulator [Dietzia sp.]|uniref:TetR family transcriptional regulator n=1 Tax=Dietzia psychralcaliphila TaxID=139021 RepID=A0AAD0JPI8_9ACTN|nr:MULTISPECIES: TetR/AcrR family transcriptional regulator [Dietzia]AWH94674.1 TetR family transcriptional regulator [Dietzia psychralcaliphila]MBB1039484.1 TetR/AcrR family transcriptional regulator [Dietzia natronolimnaea]MBB1041527.1 TetR/AcrR family transcriptional regulator [Dietzia sp. Cai40]MBB1045801.1 TetR/AcrR family transcriptional regulator [Dietzia sp. DQ11-44]MBB1054983.1 TetR/AcrR family transcriptional regulator [Dietzia sp. B44]
MTSTTRREELLAIAAGLFAERGLRATTVRDIADAAGILSGSLYHHFSSKEAIVDEILRGFLDSLFGDYQRIVDAGSSPRETLEGLVRVSFEAIHRHRDEVAIYQDELKHLRGNPRFDYLRERNTEFREMWTDVLSRGMESGEFRPDLDIRLTYRFLRDTVWVAVRWYRPEDADDHAAIADQYLRIVLDGLAVD